MFSTEGAIIYTSCQGNKFSPKTIARGYSPNNNTYAVTLVASNARGANVEYPTRPFAFAYWGGFLACMYECVNSRPQASSAITNFLNIHHIPTLARTYTLSGRLMSAARCLLKRVAGSAFVRISACCHSDATCTIFASPDSTKSRTSHQCAYFGQNLGDSLP